MRLVSFISVLSIGFMALSLSAEPTAKPSPAEVQKVMQYFIQGQGQGPILREFTPCLKIGKIEGEKKKSCLEPAGNQVTKKTALKIWTRWFVPKDDKYEVEVAFIHEGQVRATKVLKIKTGYSYATWTAKGLYKTGNWEIKLTHGQHLLASKKIVVAD